MENKILATINGIEVSEMDIKQALERFPQDRQQYLSTEQGMKELLEQMISFELFYNYAKDEELSKDEVYQIQLKKIEKELLTQYAISKVLSTVEVTEEEARDFYNNNRSMFIQPEAIRAKHILVDSKEKADEIIQEINGGLSFEEAANKYSSCPSKEQGGDLGFFTKGSMVPEFEEAAFKLNINEVSEPVQTQFGYHIIKVEERKLPEIKSFEEVGAYIANNLHQEKQNRKFYEFTNSLKNKYDVEYK